MAHPLAETEPMEAKLVDALPIDEGWQFEPKWDGFRAIASRLGGHVELRSRSGKSLARFFPEIVTALEATNSDDYVLDSELILPIQGVLSFDALQARLHPAESRIHRLSRETPAQLMLFDCLILDGKPLIERPLTERRAELERFHSTNGTASLLLSPRTLDLAGAQVWLSSSGGALDGVIAKSLEQGYRPGERAMLKVKQRRTADCVVGGFRLAKDGPLVASLLLGLYDDTGMLNHVGFTSALGKQDRAHLTQKLKRLISPPGFTGKAPGGPVAGTMVRRVSGFRLSLSSLSKSASIRSPMTAFVMGRGSYDGVRTRHRDSAAWISSTTRLGLRSSLTSASNASPEDYWEKRRHSGKFDNNRFV